MSRSQLFVKYRAHKIWHLSCLSDVYSDPYVQTQQSVSFSWYNSASKIKHITYSNSLHMISIFFLPVEHGNALPIRHFSIFVFKLRRIKSQRTYVKRLICIYFGISVPVITSKRPQLVPVLFCGLNTNFSK